MLPDGAVDFVNEHGAKLTDSAGSQETNVDRLASMVHPDDYKSFSEIISESLANGTELEWNGRLKNHTGEYRWVLTRMVPLLGTDGRLEKWIATTTDINELWITKLGLRETNEELEKTLSRVRQLEGLLSVCSFCKKIRDENDEWQHMESYISTRSDTKFSHGICPSCGIQHYGNIWESVNKRSI